MARQRKTNASARPPSANQAMHEKLSLNYCQIYKLDFDGLPLLMQRQLGNIKKLYLSNNYLKTLEGIEVLKNLTHLSV